MSRRQVDSRKSPQQDNLDEALMRVLRYYADAFAANLNAVSACRGPQGKLQLKDPSSAPYVAPIRHFTPKQRKIIQTKIEKLHKAGAIVSSTNQYASCCHTVRKKDGTVRVVQNFRGLDAHLKAQSGGPWGPLDYLR